MGLQVQSVLYNLFRSLLLLSSLFIFGCEKEKTPEIAKIDFNDLYNFSESEYSSYLNNTFTDTTFKLSYHDTLQQFYEIRNFHPHFIKSFNEQDLIYALINVFEKAEDHGLNPESYHVSAIQEEFTKAVDTSFSGNRYIHLAHTEKLVADGIIKYSYHLRYGVVDPKKVFEDSYFIPTVDSASRDLFEPLRQENILEYLNNIQPKSEKYVKLQEGLKHYLKFKDLEWKPITISKKKLVPKDSDTAFYFIAERLTTLGFLDTSVAKRTDPAYYDTLLVNAVKKFQKIHGLNDDGVIGATTVNRLNFTPADYINKIKLSLERFRWADYSGTPEYALVNIPDFYLYVYKNGEAVFDSKVCTGSRRSSTYEDRYNYYKKTKNWRVKPEDWETPVLASEISYMVLNPTWTVPPNIIRQEIAAGVRKDSLYLEKKNFRIYKGTTEVSAASIKPGELSAGNIEYRIVQNPGAGNALGKIKFMFDNPFGVYLHDTPTRAPFSNSDRAVSHGCVRVEKPLAFSEFILEHQSKWNLDYLKIEVGSKVDDKSKIAEFRNLRSDLRRNHSYGQTTEVRLDKKVKLFIDYYTSWVDDEGNVNFRDDVYRKDKKLLEMLISLEAL